MQYSTGVPADLDPPPSKWTPPGQNPLANMDLWGSLLASGFGLPSRIWTTRISPCVVTRYRSLSLSMS
jgi:hypothetical protein